MSNRSNSPNSSSFSNSLEGHLLIATPSMTDPRFQRTVVLMLHHDHDGAMGVVLNRALPSTTGGPWQLLQTMAGESDRRVQLGGPVSGPLIVMQHSRMQTEEDIEVQTSQFFVVQRQEQLQELIAQAESPLSFFVGHANWSPSQLEKEIEGGYWLTMPADPHFVCSTEIDTMWRSAVRYAGQSFYRDVLGIYDFPADVSLN